MRGHGDEVCSDFDSRRTASDRPPTPHLPIETLTKAQRMCIGIQALEEGFQDDNQVRYKPLSSWHLLVCSLPGRLVFLGIREMMLLLSRYYNVCTSYLRQ